MGIVKRFWMPALGVLAIVAAVAVAATSPIAFGWFAYAPTSDTVFAVAPVTTQQVVGVAVGAIGLMLVAGWGGYRIGRRRRKA